ncbi:hypothetical protein DL771_008986 [Monosporascus sp. 5C6A]|nr:hypothetical protein DL771_008986 [Monosporascus sp. 5C6A]
MTDRYVYPYLETGHIRLLHILSVAPDIRVRIEVVSLNKSPSLPEYTALSYLWGEDKPFGRVIIEPESQDIEITRNLSICLSHLGDFVGTKIWIDALCINQRDSEEKSRQVSRMGAEGSDAAMDGIIRFGRAAVDAGLLDLENHHLKTWPDVGDDPVHVRTRDAVLALIAMASNAEKDTSQAGKRFPRVAFARLTHREYFNRVWVQQEITLARHGVVMCGHKCADAESFQATITFYAWLVMWEVSEYMAGRQTQIPGIFSEEILIAAAGGPLTLIQTPSANPAAGCFFTGRMVPLPTRSSADLVPDFSNNIVYTWSDGVGVPLFKATGSRKQPTESHSSIRRPTKLMPFDQTAAQKMFTEIEAFLQSPSIYPATSWIDANWRIPICDREYHPTSAFFRRATVEYSRPQYITLRNQPLSGDAIAQTFSYTSTMKYRDGARPICSVKGYVGLGPCWAEPGDIMVFLDGATAPFLLRPAEDAARCYHLVGEIYVYGVMDGEMMDKGLEEVTFKLL